MKQFLQTLLTTGYEEAGAQGLISGINAASFALGKEPFYLKRSESYIGVLIDDLVTKTLEEPYRMFTSRAEHRLLLRQDNADLRLREYGYVLGMIDEKKYAHLKHKKETIEKESHRLGRIHKQVQQKGVTLAQLLCRPEVTYETLLKEYPEEVFDHGSDINLQIELNLKYAGYIQRQEQEVARFSHLENVKIPTDFAYESLVGLRKEAIEKLKKFLPQTVGQAARLSGVSPADIQILLIALQRRGGR